MPTYQYSCTECGHFFEIQQSFTDDSLTVCPDCDGRLRKVFNAVGVVFKGSGFYRNDSRGEQKSAVAANGSSNGSSDKGSGSDSSGSSTSTTSSPKESSGASGGASSSNGSGSSSGSGSTGSSSKGSGTSSS